MLSWRVKRDLERLAELLGVCHVVNREACRASPNPDYSYRSSGQQLGSAALFDSASMGGAARTRATTPLSRMSAGREAGAQSGEIGAAGHLQSKLVKGAPISAQKGRPRTPVHDAQRTNQRGHTGLPEG